MSSVAQSNSSVVQIRDKVRRLTASPSPSTLSDQKIDEAINTFFTQDFVASIKTDQLREAYEFYTQPNVGIYKLNINKEISIRTPCYVDGKKSLLYKDRLSFYNHFPRSPTKSIVGQGDGATTLFSFTISTSPILARFFVLGTKDSVGNSIAVDDEGGIASPSGNLRLVITDPATGEKTFQNIGTIDYVTGACTIDFPVPPGAGENIEVSSVPYTAGFPYAILFWKDEFIVRPIPDGVYKISVQTYKNPAQFLSSSETPFVEQWWQYIAYGAALEITRERGDLDGVAEITEGFRRQERLVLERQANAEIGKRNETKFTSTDYFYAGWW